MKAKLIAITSATKDFLASLESEIDLSENERLIAYVARVSSPNQLNNNYEGLIKYCLDNKHWSVFESVSMTMEIKTTRSISEQILRHKSCTFQEFSQRYAVAKDYTIHRARLQDPKNRQNSVETDDEELHKWFHDAQKEVGDLAFLRYTEALEKGIARELARDMLPLSTNTRLYVTGNVRSWIHYIEARTKPESQKEHRDIAEDCKKIFMQQFPIISKALGWV